VRRMETRLRNSSQLVEDLKAIVALLSAAPRPPAQTAHERSSGGQGTSTRKPRKKPIT
jgi:hypothetical protein